MHLRRTALFLLALAASAAPRTQQVPTQQVMDAWLRARFASAPASAILDAERRPYLRVPEGRLERDILAGQRLLVASRRMAHGLAQRTPGLVEIVVPSGARRFHALLGVDSNDAGYYSNSGRGSVVATVEANGKTLFTSPVLHEGLAAIPVDLDLAGATRFSLRLITRAAKHPYHVSEWEQADWGEATVTLDDGSVLPLSGLPAGSPANFLSTPSELPFSFRLDGAHSSSVLPSWRLERSERRLDNAHRELTLSFTDPSSHLNLRAVAVFYDDFPVAEWTLHFRHDGSSPSPLIEDLQALDLALSAERGSSPLLRRIRGSFNSPEDFRLVETPLPARSAQQLHSESGRGSDGEMPLFNLDAGGYGAIFALGWPGQWAASFARDDKSNLRIRGGQQLTRFRLQPGEQARSPLAVILLWDGDWLDGQNLWRRWMLAHNLPRPNGALPQPFVSASSSRFTVEMQTADEANQIRFLSRLRQNIPYDYWWMDAGWYACPEGWPVTGTWAPDPARFPNGLRPVTDAAHRLGLKTIVWFEPERVRPGTWLYENHPAWLLGADGKQKMLNLGLPEALAWATDHFSSLLDREAIDLYRQDFNMEPLPLWRAADAPDRQGLTENHHVSGYLAYFDALRARRPSLLIDTCASGGRRLDLETLRRAVPLWRSDHPFDQVSQQAQSYSLALWIPFHGTAINSLDPYLFWSQSAPALGIGLDPDRLENGPARLKSLLDAWRRLAPFYSSDYYPLTPYSLDDSAWLAWQFHDPKSGNGAIQAFRRAASPFDSARLRLRALDPAASYLFTPLHGGPAVTLKGSELAGPGFPARLASMPQAGIWLYRKL